jgi:hypothetical protein
MKLAISIPEIRRYDEDIELCCFLKRLNLERPLKAG